MHLLLPSAVFGKHSATCVRNALLLWRKLLRLIPYGLCILSLFPRRPVLLCFLEFRRHCAIAVAMSDGPQPQDTTSELASANAETGTEQSWITHPAAAVVKATIGHRVLIVLNDLRELQGTCTCFDWLGNFVLSDWTQDIPAPPSGSFCSSLNFERKYRL